MDLVGFSLSQSAHQRLLKGSSGLIPNSFIDRNLKQEQYGVENRILSNEQVGGSRSRFSINPTLLTHQREKRERVLKRSAIESKQSGLGSPSKKKVREVSFAYAIRSFVGHLQGTHKSEHTIRNYRLDLLAFQRFMEASLPKERCHLSLIGTRELLAFQEALKQKGLRANTRRRKVLTVRAFLKYLVLRRQAPKEAAQQVAAPEKIERVPLTTSAELLRTKISMIPIETLLDLRNQTLFSVLLETAAQVSEVCLMEWGHWSEIDARSHWVQIVGKNPRKVEVSLELRALIERLKNRIRPQPETPEARYLFLGYNRFGSLGKPISSRAIELLVRSYSSTLAVERLTPRTFRQSRVLEWFQSGVEAAEIQRRLGLRTAYAFRAFEPILRADSPSRRSDVKLRSQSK